MSETQTNVIQFKYKPKGWANVLGNKRIVGCLSQKTIHDVENYAFLGPEGVGKGVCAELLGKTLFGGRYKEWNMSLEGTKDTVRDEIMKYCKSGSIEGMERKLAIFQEADNISFQAQQALREPMEKFKKKIVFIITANYEGKILPPILSRCCPMRFALIPTDEIDKFTRNIITKEKIKAEEDQILEVIHQAKGRARNVCSLIAGWTSGGVLHIENRRPLLERLNGVFKFLATRDLDGGLDLIQQLLTETSDRTIVGELTNLIREHTKMPAEFKSKALIITCETFANIVQGVDPHTALFSMVSRLLLNFPKKSD